MYHMPATGQCGFDCYIVVDGTPLYCSTTRFSFDKDEYESVLFEKADQTLRTIILYFPLYQGVERVEIGLEQGAALLPPPDDTAQRKVIFYGSSITQGGCASRPGMAYPNIINRTISGEFINLGFSGNGKGEPEMARIISDIADPDLLVLDYEANCGGAETLQRTLPQFIDIYREAHPETAILVLSKIPYAQEMFQPSLRKEYDERRAIQKETVDIRQLKGDGNIYFYDGAALLGEFFYECTVDGVHPTDLGFFHMAQRLEPVLLRILNGE